MAHYCTPHSLDHTPPRCSSAASQHRDRSSRTLDHFGQPTSHAGDERRTQRGDALEKTSDTGVTSHSGVVVAHVVAHHSPPFPRAASCERIRLIRSGGVASDVRGFFPPPSITPPFDPAASSAWRSRARRRRTLETRSCTASHSISSCLKALPRRSNSSATSFNLRFCPKTVNSPIVPPPSRPSSPPPAAPPVPPHPPPPPTHPP